MSASFIRLHKTTLKQLTAAITGSPQTLAGFLTDNGSPVAEFDGDARIFSILLPVLAEDYEIDLETSENDIIADLAELSQALIFILTPDEQAQYLDQLAPETYSVEALADAYEDFTGDDTNKHDAGKAMLASISALHQALKKIDEEHVVVVMIE